MTNDISKKLSDSKPISIQDIQAGFNQLAEQTNQTRDAIETESIPILLAIGGIALLGIVYFMGRKRGKKRSTLVELRRI